MKALAVIPWTFSPLSVVTTVTPVVNIPSVRRSAAAGSSPSSARSGRWTSATSSKRGSPMPSGPAQLSGKSNSAGGRAASLMSCARAGLVRVVEREAHDLRGDALLEPVELAHLDVCAELRVLH